MSETKYDMIKSALIKEAVEKMNFFDSFEEVMKNYMTPVKFKRMWKKITGEEITLEEARNAINR